MIEHPEARIVIDTLNKAGFIAYYAGGWVRDFLLQLPSDDIDIATNAPPETIQALFPRTVPIGITFGIILVLIGDQQYEVATFRQDLDYQDGRRPTRVVFSTAEQDAKRRDFTINGMFYDPIRQEIFDYVGGREDLAAKVIRAIGNPHERIKEDRLRMIRAVRLACRFSFRIDPATQDAIRAHAKELFPAVAIERIVQELTKGRAFSSFCKMILMLHEFGLLVSIFPSIEEITYYDLEHRLAPIARYPKSAPLITLLLPIFPDYTLDQQIDLCKKLKIPNLDMQFVSFLYLARERIEDQNHHIRVVENVEWAYFYAHPFCQTSLEIIAADLDPTTAATFLQQHKECLTSLNKAIDRIHNHTPVVTASELIKAGIAPGKTMGALLKEAERISFNSHIYDPSIVIQQLKQSPSWPKFSSH